YDNFSEAILTRFAQQGALPTYRQLNGADERYLSNTMAYLLGGRFLAWLEKNYSEQTLDAVWVRMQAVKKRRFQDAFTGVFGQPAERLYQRFIAEYTYHSMQQERAEPQLDDTVWMKADFSAHSPALSPNKSLLALVERNAQGVVYLARDERLKRFVAIKTLESNRANASPDDPQLKREAAAVAQLRCPQIVPLYDVGEWQGTPYLVFEYVEGETLAARIKSQGSIPVFDALSMLQNILDGLEHAHQQGVLHCDIKPSNIMIDSDGTARILDFGISRLVTEKAPDKSKLEGSIYYLAPELLAGDHCETRSDIYACGALLYEMLTGQRAIKATDSAAALYEIAHGDVSRPSVAVNSISSKVDAIVLTSMARAPVDRYADATQMKGAIQTFLDDNGELEVHDSKHPHGNTVNYLFEKIRRNSDFPAFSQHIVEINRLAASESDATVVELTNAVLRDYSLTNKLLRLVNSSVYGQFGGQITTVSRAITILGFDNIRMLAVGLLIFDQIKNRPQVKSLMEASLWSFVAAFLSRRVAGKAAQKHMELTFISTLLHNLGNLLVIFYLPDEYESIQKLVQQNGISEEAATRKVLGTPIYKVGQHVAESWGLPNILINAMAPADPDGTLKGHDDFTAVLNTVNFSNGAIDVAKSSDGASANKKLEELATRYDGIVSIEPNELQSTIQNCLEQAFDVIEFPRDWKHEMRAITGLESSSSESGQGDVETESKPVAFGDQTDLEVLLSGLNDVTNMMMSERGLSEILGTVLETLHRGLSVNRTLLFINNSAKDEMRVRFGFAPEFDKIKQSLSLKLQGDDTIVAALSERRDLLVKSADDEGVMLPQWCSRALRAVGVGVFPIVIGKSLVGAIYFDSPSPRSYSSRELELIQSLRNQVALAIKMNS
ncbi:MAG: HDOD domain-containing protein, partial [Pseudomonadota bacterium]